MQAQVTRYFYEWLDSGGVIPSILNDMPKWQELDFVEVFKERNKYKEIGAETDELFQHYLNKTANEVVALYQKKLQMQIDNFDDLYQRIIKEEYEHNNENYLNPIDNNTPQLDSYEKNYGNNDKIFSFHNSNPDLMKKVNNIEVVFMSALEYMDRLFIGVL